MSTKKPREFDFDFDPDFSHLHPNNQDAAKERGYRFDETGGVYRDADGCPVLDRFGQPLG